MNDGYRYKNGKVIVSEYNADNANVREEKEREYQDNIEEILVAENMIEYFKGLRKEVKDDIDRKNSSINAEKISMYICLIPAIFANACIGGGISAILKFCLHLSGLLPMISLDNIAQIAFLISTSGTAIYYINKIIKPSNENIQSLKKQINLSKFTIKTISEEIERQKTLIKKLNCDKRKDNTQSLEYVSQCKNSSDYIRLDYVEQIDNIEENIWGLVDIEEERMKQEESGPVKKLTPPKNR